MKVRWTSLSELPFFGLTPDSPQVYFNVVKKNVLEEIFFCVYYGKLNYSDAYNLPAQVRRWWINKTVELIQKENKSKNPETM
jgi:hypothetical protein